MATETDKIQRVVFSCCVNDVYCPFCGSIVIDSEKSGDWVTPCPHTLFVADDNFLLHRSPLFDELMKIEGVKEKDIEYGEGYTDGFTDQVCCPDSVKFAIYQPAPSGFGFYIGFAPAEWD